MKPLDFSMDKYYIDVYKIYLLRSGYLKKKQTFSDAHCLKYVRIMIFFDPYFYKTGL